MLCQNCRIAFNALNTLAETAEEAVPDGVATANPPMLGRGEVLASPGIEQGAFNGLTKNGLPSLSAAPGASLGGYDVWEEESEVRPASRAGRMAFGFGVPLLLALLVLQIGLFEGNHLAQDERLRPWLEIACGELGCSLPQYKDVRQIQIIDRALQPAPDDIDGLEFILVVANEARFAQAFPAIKLVLTEVTGKPVAARIFSPGEYLDENQTGPMPVGKPFEIRLLLAKPSREVGGFNFELI